MLRLCICDDKEADVIDLHRLAQMFSEEHPEIPIQIEVFQSAYDLLDCIGDSGGFDLYLLDIIMPNLSGIELAKRIRERGEMAEILFLTVSREYAVEAFGVKASNYLIELFFYVQAGIDFHLIVQSGITSDSWRADISASSHSVWIFSYNLRAYYSIQKSG